MHTTVYCRINNNIHCILLFGAEGTITSTIYYCLLQNKQQWMSCDQCDIINSHVRILNTQHWFWIFLLPFGPNLHLTFVTMDLSKIKNRQHIFANLGGSYLATATISRVATTTTTHIYCIKPSQVYSKYICMHTIQKSKSCITKNLSYRFFSPGRT